MLSYEEAKAVLFDWNGECRSGAVIAPFWLWLPVTGGGWSAAS